MCDPPNAIAVLPEHILTDQIPELYLPNTPVLLGLCGFKSTAIPAMSFPNYFLQRGSFEVTKQLSLPLFHKQLPSTAVISGTSARRVSFGLTE